MEQTNMVGVPHNDLMNEDDITPTTFHHNETNEEATEDNTTTTEKQSSSSDDVVSGTTLNKSYFSPNFPAKQTSSPSLRPLNVGCTTQSSSDTASAPALPVSPEVAMNILVGNVTINNNNIDHRHTDILSNGDQTTLNLSQNIFCQSLNPELMQDLEQMATKNIEGTVPVE